MGRIIETETGFSKAHRFKAVERKQRRAGGTEHRRNIRRKIQIAELRAEEELRMFEMGEPSQALFPYKEKEDTTVVVFEENKSRKGDLAKRRGEIINTILEDPWQYPRTENNLSFIERHFPRILRFARTLKNKNRVHPGVQEILNA